MEGTVARLEKLCWPYKSLPPWLHEAVVRETQTELAGALEDLRKPDASSELLSYVLRRLERVRDYGRDPVGLHVPIALELWRLLRKTTLGYALRRKVSSALHHRLRGLRKEFVPGRGLRPMSNAQVDNSFLSELRESLSWRVVQDMIFGEIERCHRGAQLENPSNAQHFAEALAPLLNELRHWTDVSAAPEIVESLAPWMDPSQRSIVLYSRLMLMALPTEACVQFIEDGRLYRWWEQLPRGANSRFSVMWFVLPARAAKMRWASGEPWAPGHVLPPDRMSSMMDTIAGTMCLPVDESKASSMDHFTEDCVWAFLGKTTYLSIAKFVVYSLEPLQSNGAFAKGSMWAILELLCRRLAPCMIHTGSWTWHVRTFVYELIRGYYIRVCRERFKEPGCTAHESCRTTSFCDDAFVRLLCPLLLDTLTLQSTADDQMHSITMSLSFISRLALLNRPRWEMVRTFAQECVQDLEDPMSARHRSTFLVLLGLTPIIVYSSPGLILDAAHLTLPGIDATDPLKTVVAAAFFVNLFTQVPTLDLSVQDLPEQLPSDPSEVLPVHPNGSDMVPCATPSELQMCTSTLPDLCYALLERFLEYAQGMPKPSKKDAMAAWDLAGPRMLATAIFLAAKQGDPSMVDTMIGQLVEWLSRNLVPNAMKAVSMLVGAFSLAHPRASARIMDCALGRLPLAAGGLASLGESEATWYYGILAAASRYGGALLPGKRQELEARIQAALEDKRKPVRKAGARLCRRVLMGLTAPYSGDLTGDGTVQEALHRWTGGRSLNWGSAVRPVAFHEPTAEELVFAHALFEQCLEVVRKKAEGADEDIHTALTLAKSMVRGLACLYPDERTEADAYPTVSKLPNELGSRVLSELTEILLNLCPKLGGPSHPFESSADTPCRPKLLCKALRMIVGLVKGERRPEIPDLLQIRGFDGNIRGHVSSESYTQKVHFTSAWRDISRVWYNWEVIALMNRRLHYRPTGFKFAGLRRTLAELLCGYSLHESSVVSCTAAECLHAFLRVHYGAKRVLLEDCFLPQQEKTIAGAIGLPAEKAYLAEAALQGFARTANRLFVSSCWRRGAIGALRFASVIVRTIHAFTEEGSSHVDVLPVCIYMQFELITKLCAVQTASNPGDAVEACQVAGSLLELLRQPGAHWRTKVCVMATAGPALRVLHLTGAKGMDSAVLTRWITEVLGSFSSGAPPQMAAMAVAELTAAMRSALRRPESALMGVMSELLPTQGTFLSQAIRAMSGLHQGHMGQDAGAVAQADLVQNVVHAASGRLGVPHLAWTASPSGHVWTMHAAFFQTYVAFRKGRGDPGLVEDIRQALATLQAQPKGEVEDHVVFIEVLGGVLRAARRWPAAELRALWVAIGPIAADELRSAEEENIRSWQFLVNFILSGVSRRLRLKKQSPSEDLPVLCLASFLAGPPGSESQAIALPAPPNGNTENEASSHNHATKLRLLHVLLVCLRRRRPCISNEVRVQVLSGIIPALKEGISHPYKQVHEESAKAVVLALYLGLDHEVLRELRAWLHSRAVELGPALRSAPKDSVIATSCEGLVYCFIHGLLGRRLRDLALRSADLLLAAASTDDHELRALAGLALTCLGQSPQRAREPVALAQAVAGLCREPEDADANSAQRTRRLEAAAALLGANAMRHYFALHTADGGEGVRFCREALVALLQDKRVEVRIASQTALAPLLGAQGSEACKAQVATFAALKPSDSVDRAVHGLGAMLSAAGSLGVPPWLGNVIEALAKVGKHPDAKKEVERVVQAFLKQQQHSRDLWRRCQSRLTASQMDLLKARQGTLSYYA